MVGCFAVGCCHASQRNVCKFFRFPRDPGLLAKWKKIVRRADKEPTNDNYICSCHFLDGKKENGPSIFRHNLGKQLVFKSPEKVKNPISPLMSPSSGDDEPVNEENLSIASNKLDSSGEPSTSHQVETFGATAFEGAELHFLQKEVENLKKEVLLLKNHRFSSDGEGKTLFDFTKMMSLDGWIEQSDPVRQVGKSKASFVLQTTQEFQRAIFFTLLNPQPNGAGFAGFRVPTQLDLSDKSALVMWVRGQGQNYGYKVCLRHKGLNNEPHPTYEQMFTAPREFDTVTLDLAKFEPYYRGRKMDPAEVGYLDISNITNFELQVYGGVYLPVKQFGVSSLEIDWVKAV